jgi:hypothetical protein
MIEGTIEGAIVEGAIIVKQPKALTQRALFIGGAWNKDGKLTFALLALYPASRQAFPALPPSYSPPGSKVLRLQGAGDFDLSDFYICFDPHNLAGDLARIPLGGMRLTPLLAKRYRGYLILPPGVGLDDDQISGLVARNLSLRQEYPIFPSDLREKVYSFPLRNFSGKEMGIVVLW